MRLGNLRGVATRIVRQRRFVVNPFGLQDAKGDPFVVAIRRRGVEYDEALGLALSGSEVDFESRVSEHFRRLKVDTKRGAKHNKGRTEDGVLRGFAEKLARSETPQYARELAKIRRELCARFIFEGGSGLSDDDGNPIDFSDEATRRELLEFGADPEGMVLCSAENLLAHDDGAWKPVIEDGEPVSNPWSGLPLGHAIAAWIQEQADDLDAFAAEEEAEVLGNSATSPPGMPDPSAQSIPSGEEMLSDESTMDP